MDGPYRDLGSGFARLTGIEGVRRGPSRINFVEDALLELLRNARDAAADNIYVSSSLRARRYRTLTVLDDGHGIPEPYRDLIFEPGITTRHLNPTPTSLTAIPEPVNGGGLSLYHIRNVAIEAKVLSTGSPTSIRVILDTRLVPERALQSGTRTSKSNLKATIRNFLSETSDQKSKHQTTKHQTTLKTYYGPPSTILAILRQNHIIQTNPDDTKSLREGGRRLGVSVSLRTLQRLMRGNAEAPQVFAMAEVLQNASPDIKKDNLEEKSFGTLGNFSDGPRIELNQEEISRIAAILGEAALTRYLEVGELTVESRPGGILFEAPVYEPEEEYE